jgi:hypothetical protein
MNAPLNLTAAHRAHVEHARWCAAVEKLSASLDNPRLAYARDFLIRGLQHAYAQVERLDGEVRIAPPEEPRRVNLGAYSMACAPSDYRSVV